MHESDSPGLQQAGRLGLGHERQQRDRERAKEAPGKLPWLCLQQKAIVWCGRTAGSKAPAPTGCTLGKMPDGGHCWMTFTSPQWDSQQSPPWASREISKTITTWRCSVSDLFREGWVRSVYQLSPKRSSDQFYWIETNKGTSLNIKSANWFIRYWLSHYQSWFICSSEKAREVPFY